VKFLCDRCKTRYSIADDRVRGKILKIRCKNCANVITVREGMPDADAVDPGRLRGKSTTQSPAPATAIDAPASRAVGNGTGGAPALNTAFANAMSKPPPALEEEWYVSIDGDQSGPFTLAEAQRWVAAKPFDAELYCWSEGFDDWLPVDKVSHFRGLRKKPAAPPPLPRLNATGGMRAMSVGHARDRDPIDESEPKPLFAATMASLQKDLPAVARPAPAPAPVISTKVAPAVPARPSATPPRGTPALPMQAKGPAANGRRLGFDASEHEAPTAIGGPAYDAKRAGETNDAFVKALGGALDTAATQPKAPAAKDEPAPSPDPDDELSIGEVSRVVKLADLARPRRQSQLPAPRRSQQLQVATPSASTSGTHTATIGRLTGTVPKVGGTTAAVQKLNVTGTLARLDPAVVDGIAPPTSDASVAVAAVRVSHRRGLIALIVAAVLLLGGAIAVVVFMNNDDDGPASGDKLTQYYFDPTNPTHVIKIVQKEPGKGSDVAPNQPGKITTHRPTIPTRPEVPPTPGMPDKIDASEVEAMAGKYNDLTKRCYQRAQRGAAGVIVGDVKKLNVTLQIATDGTISDVQLSDNHTKDPLGACIVPIVRSWKFRASAGGTYRFTMVFG
jgi:predicted Zn finger-like uncharacterized protein